MSWRGARVIHTVQGDECTSPPLAVPVHSALSKDALMLYKMLQARNQELENRLRVLETQVLLSSQRGQLQLYGGLQSSMLGQLQQLQAQQQQQQQQQHQQQLLLLPHLLAAQQAHAQAEAEVQLHEHEQAQAVQQAQALQQAHAMQQTQLLMRGQGLLRDQAKVKAEGQEQGAEVHGAAQEQALEQAVAATGGAADAVHAAAGSAARIALQAEAAQELRGSPAVGASGTTEAAARKTTEDVSEGPAGDAHKLALKHVIESRQPKQAEPDLRSQPATASGGDRQQKASSPGAAQLGGCTGDAAALPAAIAAAQAVETPSALSSETPLFGNVNVAGALGLSAVGPGAPAHSHSHAAHGMEGSSILAALAARQAQAHAQAHAQAQVQAQSAVTGQGQAGGSLHGGSLSGLLSGTGANAGLMSSLALAGGLRGAGMGAHAGGSAGALTAGGLTLNQLGLSGMGGGAQLAFGPGGALGAMHPDLASYGGAGLAGALGAGADPAAFLSAPGGLGQLGQLSQLSQLSQLGQLGQMSQLGQLGQLGQLAQLPGGATLLLDRNGQVLGQLPPGALAGAGGQGMSLLQQHGGLQLLHPPAGTPPPSSSQGTSRHR